MQAMADWGGGPGPWILLFPLIWAAVIGGVVTVVRRTGVGGRIGPWRGPVAGSWRGPAARPAGDSPLGVLGRRFASGEIDEEEYWRRMSVLEEYFGRLDKAGAR
ncbi:SHOCT domain-containing protein [Streptomyces sp. NPDC004042]|uniref:SHOCT domain-containing protein n=1 Tax=Streptomyces sp. NPDC004042 TaxID=3154451 RepID=UPI0033AA3086